MLLVKRLEQLALKNPHQVAIRCLDRSGQAEHEIDVTTLLNRVGYLTGRYHAELGPKSRVGILAANSPAVVTSFLAFANCRAVSVPINPRLPEDELVNCLADAELTHLAVGTEWEDSAPTLLEGSGVSLPIFEIEKDYRAVSASGASATTAREGLVTGLRSDEDPAVLLRTAGMTGLPNFALFDQRSLDHAALCLKGIYATGAADRVCTLHHWSHPFFWMHGMLYPVLTGSALVIASGPTETDPIFHLKQSGTTHFLTDSGGARSFLKACKEQGTKVPSLKAMAVGIGGVVSEDQTQADELELPLLSCYGQAETLWSVAFEELGPVSRAYAGERRSRAVGGLKFKLFDDHGDEVPKKGDERRAGQLAISGPVVMRGYRGAQKEESAGVKGSVLRGTWYHTGDVVWLDGSGESSKIRFIGKREELLVRSHPTISHCDCYLSPEPIDLLLRKFPGIQDAAGFVVTERNGDKVFACAVVREPNQTLKKEEILAHCRASLAEDEAPRYVVFVSLISRSGLHGAVNRIQLSRKLQVAALSSGPAEPIAEPKPEKKPILPAVRKKITTAGVAEELRSLLKDRRALVVDEAATVRTAVASLLSELGISANQIALGASYEDAAQFSEQGVDFGLIVTDYMIGRRSGIELGSELLGKVSDPNRCVVLVMTQDSQQSSVAEAAEGLVDGYLLKPFSAAAFKEYVARVIERKLYPSDSQAILDGVRKHLRKDEYYAAKEMLEIAAQYFPNPPAIFLVLAGQVTEGLGDFAGARDYYRQALKAQEKNYLALIGMFRLDQKLGNQEAAYRGLAHLAELFPLSPQRLCQALALAVLTGNFADVDGYFQTFLEIDERREELVRTMTAALIVGGIFHLRNHRYDEARTLFQRGIVTSRRSPEIIGKAIYQSLAYDQTGTAAELFKLFEGRDTGSTEYVACRVLLSHLDSAPTESNTVLALGHQALQKEDCPIQVYRVVLKRLKDLHQDKMHQTIRERALGQWDVPQVDAPLFALKAEASDTEKLKIDAQIESLNLPGVKPK